jgi:hypothetical protein
MLASVNVIDGLAVYSCDECLVPGELFGEPVEYALTFTVDKSGAVTEVPHLDDQ